jgi:hypothetical protein
MKNANFKRRTNDRKIVRGLMKKKGITLDEMARRTGYTNKKNVFGVLSEKHTTGMTTDVLIRFLSAIDCDISIFDMEDGTEYPLSILGGDDDQ